MRTEVRLKKAINFLCVRDRCSGINEENPVIVASPISYRSPISAPAPPSLPPPNRWTPSNRALTPDVQFQCRVRDQLG